MLRLFASPFVPKTPGNLSQISIKVWQFLQLLPKDTFLSNAVLMAYSEADCVLKAQDPKTKRHTTAKLTVPTPNLEQWSFRQALDRGKLH